MNAYSLIQIITGPNLDQSNSVDAMAAMQQFLNRYPQQQVSRPVD
jgi:outer membrane protein assembly factor BamD (BamD/ComL family)